MSNRLHWTRLLAFVTGLVNQDLLLRNEYLLTENRILRAHLDSRLRLTDAERRTLAEIAKRVGRKSMKDIAQVAKPDTILGWFNRLVAAKFDSSAGRAHPGRPRISAEVEQLVVRFARESRGWGYDRIVGALANLGYHLSDQTGGEHSPAAQYRPGARTRADNHLEGVHPIAYGRVGGRRFRYGGGADVARAGDLLRPVLH